jgi:hypothetical protein
MSDIVEGYMYQYTKDVITRVTSLFSKPDYETQIVMPDCKTYDLTLKQPIPV